MLVRRPRMPNPPRHRSVEARMAWRSLHWLNPRVHSVNGTGRIRRIQLRRPGSGQEGPRVLAGSAPRGWAVVNSHKGPNGTPTPSSDVTCVGTRDRLRGASPTNGLRRRSTRSTPGAGLTAGANRTRRARTCGEGVQASNRCQRCEVCVMQKIEHILDIYQKRGAHSPSVMDAFTRGPEGPALRRLLESVVR
jgi:hypothetical protein